MGFSHNFRKSSQEEDFGQIIWHLSQISDRLTEIRDLLKPAAPELVRPGTCSKCGLVFDGSIGYACPNMSCPMQAHSVI